MKAEVTAPASAIAASGERAGVAAGAVFGTGPGGLPIVSVCGKCGKAGHNSRTCGQKSEAKPVKTKGVAPAKKPAPARTKERAAGAASAKATSSALEEVEAAIAELREDLEALEQAAEVLRRRA